MNKKIIIISLVIISVLLTACGQGPKSGKRYEKHIIDSLAYSYSEDFEVVDRIGFNSQGYEKLIVSPVNDPNIQFYADIGFYTLPGGLTRSRQVNHDYINAIFYTYAPELYLKHLGITIPEDYYAEVLTNGYDDGRDLLESLNSPYVISEIKESDFQWLSLALYEVLKELYEHRPPKTSFTLTDIIRIPIAFENSEEVSHYTVEYAANLPYDSYEIFNSLKRNYSVVMERSSNDYEDTDPTP